MAPPVKLYTDDERRAALEMAAAHGRRAAIRHLGISTSTFQKWTERYPDLWSALRANDREAQKKRYAQNLEDLADSYAATEFEAIERAERLIKTADAKETAALIKAMGSSRGAAAVTAQRARGELVEHHEHHIDFPQIEAAMERLLESSAPQLPLPVENEAERP